MCCMLHLQAKRVEEVRRASDIYTMQLKEKIDNKMEVAQGNREAQCRSIQERLRDHVRLSGSAILPSPVISCGT